MRVQLIDTPPITADYLESYLVEHGPHRRRHACSSSTSATTTAPSPPRPCSNVWPRSRRISSDKPPAEIDDPTIHYGKTMLVANKTRLRRDAADRLEMVREMFAARFPIHLLDAESGNGLEELRTAHLPLLNVIRVYSKRPGKPADMESPFTCPAGSTVVQMAELVHRDFADKLKSARIWGTGVFDGQTVTRDHILHDKDIVELHV